MDLGVDVSGLCGALRVPRGDGVALGVCPLAAALGLRPLAALLPVSTFSIVHPQPPIGARGLAPQKIWVQIIPIRCMATILSTIDFAVAAPTPTGPPPAV